MTMPELGTTRIVTAIESIGLSPKMVRAALAPVVLAAGIVLVNWITTGAFDTGELRIAAAGAIGGLTSGVAAWLADPGQVRVPAP